MPEQAHRRRRRTALKIAFGISVAALAVALPREINRLVMLGFTMIAWITIVGGYLALRGEERSSELLPYVFLVTLALALSAIGVAASTENG